MKITPEPPDPESHLIAGGAAVTTFAVTMRYAADYVAVAPVDRGTQFHSLKKFCGKVTAFIMVFGKKRCPQECRSSHHAVIDHGVLHAGGVSSGIRKILPDFFRIRKKIKPVIVERTQVIVNKIGFFAKQKPGDMFPGIVHGVEQMFVHKVYFPGLSSD